MIFDNNKFSSHAPCILLLIYLLEMKPNIDFFYMYKTNFCRLS